jgi:hypothetical protein
MQTGGLNEDVLVKYNHILVTLTRLMVIKLFTQLGLVVQSWISVNPGLKENFY